MEECSLLATADGAVFEERAQGVFHGKTRIARCSQCFGDDNTSAFSHQKQIGKSSTDVDANAVHGSDGAETARLEIAYFFPTSEVHSR